MVLKTLCRLGVEPDHHLGVEVVRRRAGAAARLVDAQHGEVTGGGVDTAFEGYPLRAAARLNDVDRATARLRDPGS